MSSGGVLLPKDVVGTKNPGFGAGVVEVFSVV